MRPFDVGQLPPHVGQREEGRGQGRGRVAAEGERLYVEKPTLRGDANVTWSYDEYGHPGLQLYYLKLKSWQRFTETYALMERAGRRGLFDAPRPEGRPLRVVCSLSRALSLH